MPLARKIKINGRHYKVPRVDTIAAFVVAHPWDMSTAEVADRAAGHGYVRASVHSQVSTVRKKFPNLRWNTGYDPTIPWADLLTIPAVFDLADSAVPDPEPEVNAMAAEVDTDHDRDEYDDAPKIPGRGPTHVVRSVAPPPADVVTVHADTPARADLRVVPPAFANLAAKLAAVSAVVESASPPPRPPPTAAPDAGTEANIRAWIEMGASLLEPMAASERTLRARSHELEVEITRLQTEYAEVTGQANALAAYIGVVTTVRGGGAP